MLPSLYNKHNTNIHAPGGIRTHNASKRAAADPHFRPRGQWDQQLKLINKIKQFVPYKAYFNTEELPVHT
jgi:hypothetical protein